MPRRRGQPVNSDAIPDRIEEAQDRFIASWSQMASAWGISRTMAEAHALLYITGRAMNTDEVIERLEISRGNASMSLRALQDWGLIARVHRRGDRKEYFEAERDVWAVFKTIARERKKRELDPVLVSLYEIRDLTGTQDDKNDAAGTEPARSLRAHNERLDAMLEFMTTMEKLASVVTTQEGAGLRVISAILKTFV